MSVKEKDASVIQKIGIYLREKKQFQKSCELLEKVLEVPPELEEFHVTP